MMQQKIYNPSELKERLKTAAKNAGTAVQSIDTRRVKYYMSGAAELAKTRMSTVDTESVYHTVQTAAGAAAKQLQKVDLDAAGKRLATAAEAVNARVKAIDLDAAGARARQAERSLKRRVDNVVGGNRDAFSAERKKPALSVHRKQKAESSTEVAGNPLSLEQAVADYNAAHLDMSDCSIGLYLSRSMAADLFLHVDRLISGITGMRESPEFPDAFEVLEQLNQASHAFLSAADSAAVELAGAQCRLQNECSPFSEDAASILPVAAMWTAGLYGVHTVDDTISVLAGQKDIRPAAAWFDVGTINAENCSMDCGYALLSMAGPIVMCGDVPMLLSNIPLRMRKVVPTLRHGRINEAELISANTQILLKLTAAADELLRATDAQLEEVNRLYKMCLYSYGRDIAELTDKQRTEVAALLAASNVLAELLVKTI